MAKVKEIQISFSPRFGRNLADFTSQLHDFFQELGRPSSANNPELAKLAQRFGKVEDKAEMLQQFLVALEQELKNT